MRLSMTPRWSNCPCFSYTFLMMDEPGTQRAQTVLCFVLLVLLVLLTLLCSSSTSTLPWTTVHAQPPWRLNNDTTGFTCVPSNVTVNDTICEPYVRWHVPDWLNQTYALEEAIAHHDFSVSNGCPYYERAQYQCFKWFPLCDDSLVKNATGSVRVWPLCRERCTHAANWDNKFCLSGYGAAYFDEECHNPDALADTYGDPPNCIFRKLDTDGGSSATARKFILGIIILISAIAIFILAWWLRVYWKTKCGSTEITPADIDTENVFEGGVEKDRKGAYEKVANPRKLTVRQKKDETDMLRRARKQGGR